MAIYKYLGKKFGKKVTGTLISDDKTTVIKELKAQHIIVKKITIETYNNKWGIFNKVSDRNILFFTKKLSTMVSSGIPLLDSLKLVDSQIDDKKLKTISNGILKDLDGGLPLSEAILKYPNVFDGYYLNMVKAGELTGSLDEFLKKLSESLEKKQKIKSGIKSALLYPAMLISVAFIVAIFMLAYVVPTFEMMYKNMKVDLPEMTKTMILVGHFFSSPANLFFILLAFILIFLIFKVLNKNESFKTMSDSLILKIPIFGGIYNLSIMAKLALLMANLMAAGIGIIKILEITMNVSNNIIFKKAIANIKQGVLTGRALSTMFSSEKVFDKNFSQLLAVGEKSGDLDNMLFSVARYYEDEFDTIVANFSKIIEPVMILIVGGIIGALVIALYLPIFSSGKLIG